MGLAGKRVVQIDIKSNIDVFHHLWKHKPHHIKHLTPDHVQGCEIHEGEFGTAGNVVSWHYFNGKYEVDKVITDIDEERKLISFKVIESYLLDLYKAIQFSVHVEPSGDHNLVTWTAEYEKLDESFPDPDDHMEMFIKITKDIEAGHLCLTGKRVAHIDIKSDGDAFYDIWRHRAYEIKKLSPKIVHACDLLEGDGNVGSVISWHYFHDGKNRKAKEIIADINDTKKLISFKVIEGDLMELYKEMLITFHVETNCDNNSVTWILEYEKLNESVHDPDTLMELFTNVTKDIDAGLLKPTK